MWEKPVCCVSKISSDCRCQSKQIGISMEGRFLSVGARGFFLAASQLAQFYRPQQEKTLWHAGCEGLFVLKSSNHRRSLIVQGGLEIPVQITAEMNLTERNNEILEKYRQIAKNSGQMAILMTVQTRS